MALTEIDRRLLKQCLARTPGAWQDFVDRFVGLFLHIVQHTAHARSIRLSPDDMDDLVAEIFVTLLKDDFAVLRNFRGQSSLATYLTVVARRVAVHEIVRRRKEEALGHVAASQAARGATPPDERLRFEDADEAAELLAQLPEDDATIVRMFYIQEKSYREISAALGISENSIGPTLSRAREKLKQLRMAAASM